MKASIDFNKEAALKEFIEKYAADSFAVELFNIDDRYKENKELIDKSFMISFVGLCKKALKLQKEGKKGSIKYIYFSFLRTSIMENKAFYRFDAYDENWFLDQAECSTLWKADFILSSLFKLCRELEIKKAEYGKAVTSMDIEKIKLLEAQKYNITAYEFIKEMVPKLIEMPEYLEMNKTSDLAISFGEYMDQSEVIYKASEAEKQEVEG